MGSNDKIDRLWAVMRELEQLSGINPHDWRHEPEGAGEFLTATLKAHGALEEFFKGRPEQAPQRGRTGDLSGGSRSRRQGRRGSRRHDAAGETASASAAPATLQVNGRHSVGALAARLGGAGEPTPALIAGAPTARRAQPPASASAVADVTARLRSHADALRTATPHMLEAVVAAAAAHAEVARGWLVRHLGGDTGAEELVANLRGRRRQLRKDERALAKALLGVEDLIASARESLRNAEHRAGDSTPGAEPAS